MTNICKKCGAAILNGAKFCPQCGHPVNEQPQSKKAGCLDWILRALGAIVILFILLCVIASCSRSKDTSPSSSSSVQNSSNVSAYGTTKTFWKAYKAELENYGAPLAYGKDDQGAIGTLGENDKRLLVKLSTGVFSDKIKEVNLHIHNGDVQDLILYFAAGGKALVAMGSPDLSAEEVDEVLDELHITKNAKSGAGEYSVKRGAVTYTFKNDLEYMNGLTFTAEIK